MSLRELIAFRGSVPRIQGVLALIPLLTTFVGGAVGWKIGSLIAVWTGSVLSLIGTSLGFYYGRKLRRAATP